jgi:hypothetical protein
VLAWPRGEAALRTWAVPSRLMEMLAWQGTRYEPKVTPVMAGRYPATASASSAT